MTLSTLTTKVVHASSASVTGYAFPFRVLAAKYVRVIVADPVTFAEVELVPGTDYGVEGVDVGAGGLVVLTASGKAKAGTGKRVVILRATVFDQAVDYRPHDVFPAETHERILDKLTMHDQELREILGRAVVAPVGMPEKDIPRWGDFVRLHDEAEASAAAAKASEVAAKASQVAAAGSAVAAASSAAVAEAAEAAAAGSAVAAKASAAVAEAAAAGLEDEIAAVGSGSALWGYVINTVRLTDSGVRRSKELFKLGGY